MYVGTRNCCRPVCPPGSRPTVAPLRAIGAFTVALKGPRDVTRAFVVTPLASAGLASCAHAGERWALPVNTAARTRARVKVIGSLLVERWVSAVGASVCAKPSTGRFDVSRITSAATDCRSAAVAAPAAVVRAFRGALAGVLAGLRAVGGRCPGWAAVAGGLLLAGAFPIDAADVAVAPGITAEVVVTGIARPLQIAFAPSGELVVLMQGLRMDAAAEIATVNVRGALPVDGAQRPRTIVPFADEARKA